MLLRLRLRPLPLRLPGFTAAAIAVAAAPAARPARLHAGRPRARDGDEQLHAARAWLASLRADSIPKTVGELTFSRSSGPGGQNVNKVSSKATLRVPLDALLQHIPTALHSTLRNSRYLARSNTLIIHADDSRKQSDNAHSCYRRLHETIVEAARSAIPGETSAEQVQRVKHLQKSDNERRLKSKKQHSAKKTSRRGRGDD